MAVVSTSGIQGAAGKESGEAIPSMFASTPLEQSAESEDRGEAEELIVYPISVIACLHGNDSPKSHRGHEPLHGERRDGAHVGS
jgi:hypothetical protein